MTLILSPPYLKTIIMLQSFLSIQHTQKNVSQILNTKHIIIKQITKLLRDSKINLSEAWEINSFFKTNPPPCSKRSKWSTREKIITLKRYKWSTMSNNKNYSERYKWRSMSSWIIMQLCEDSLTFKNFRSWYFIQTASKTKENKMTLQAKHISCGE